MEPTHRQRRAFTAEYKAEVVALCRTGDKSIGAVAPGQRRHDQREKLVARVRSSRCGAEVEVLVHQLAQPKMRRQRRWQEQPCMVNQPLVVEANFRRSRLCDDCICHVLLLLR